MTTPQLAQLSPILFTLVCILLIPSSVFLAFVLVRVGLTVKGLWKSRVEWHKKLKKEDEGRR